METVLSLLVGIGLSAACGFRVFVPPLIMSIASHTGHLTLGQNFQWIGSNMALVAFSVATALEIAAYYIPWLDHLLDTIATPAAIVAGTIVTAAMVGNISPFLKWSLALIAGGGAAAVVQGATVLTRTASGATTGGLANPIVSTLELGGSIATSLLAIFVPIAAMVAMVILLIFTWKKLVPKISESRFLNKAPNR
jgi:hypothetical protein